MAIVHKIFLAALKFWSAYVEDTLRGLGVGAGGFAPCPCLKVETESAGLNLGPTQNR
jgi:hypothetical protein